MSTIPISYVAILIIAGIIALLVSMFINPQRHKDKNWWSSLFQGIATEMIGAILAAIFIISFVVPAEKAQSEAELKLQLIDEAGSVVNEVASRAIERIRDNGWLLGDESILVKQDLTEANLREAILRGRFDLNTQLFFPSNLNSAELDYATLVDANMSIVELKMASLIGADLKNANLTYSRLDGAFLNAANLFGTDLSNSCLKGAHLDDAKLNEETILPNGEQWISSVDLARFTDPNHPQYDNMLCM